MQRALQIAAGCALLWLPAAPAPAGAPSAQAIVDNERAFEQAAVARGTRAAFLEFLAESAVILEPRPAPGRAAVERGPPPGGPLRWRPDLAAISGAGDFGWASGPFLAYAKSTAELPTATGHYFTVWSRRSDEPWRVLLDGGVAYPITDARATTHPAVTPRLRPPGTGHARAGDCASAFAARWRAHGRADALEEYLAGDARLLVAGAAPLDGSGPIRRSDPLAGRALSAAHLGRSHAAERGDLVVTYGEYDLAALADAPALRYVFVSAWDVGRSCHLALEALNPAG